MKLVGKTYVYNLISEEALCKGVVVDWRTCTQRKGNEKEMDMHRHCELRQLVEEVTHYSSQKLKDLDALVHFVSNNNLSLAVHTHMSWVVKHAWF